MRIWIQLYKLKKYLIHHLINLKEFSEVEKDKKNCSKVKKTWSWSKFTVFLYFFLLLFFNFSLPDQDIEIRIQEGNLIRIRIHSPVLRDDPAWPGHGVLVVLEVQPEISVFTLTLPVGHHLNRKLINRIFFTIDLSQNTIWAIIRQLRILFKIFLPNLCVLRICKLTEINKTYYEVKESLWCFEITAMERRLPRVAVFRISICFLQIRNQP